MSHHHSDFIVWLKTQNIELRTQTHTPDGVEWLPLFKDLNDLWREYLKATQNIANERNKTVKN